MKAFAATEILGRWLLRALLGVGAVALGGCGGGEQVAGGGIVGTGISIASIGSISGIGSVTVNGVRFATTKAAVTVDGAAAPESALKVGMVVTVQGTVFPDGSATAASVDARTEVKGIVSGVDSVTRSFTVLGQRVRTDQLTVFAGGTFDTLLDQYVEVSGFRGAPGELLASRIEIRATAAPGATLEVTGTVAAFDALAKTFAIGAQMIDFSQVGSAFLPAALGNGAIAEVHGSTIGAGGRLVATEIRIVATTVPGAEDAKAELEGVVTEFASLGSFRVNGQAVDARSATIGGGTVAMLGNGAKVEVEGTLRQGVIVATKLEIEQSVEIVVDATVEAVDGTGITLGGQRVGVTATTQYEDRSAAAVREFGLAAIRVGDRLSMRAARQASGLVATRVVRLDTSVAGEGGAVVKVEGAITDFVSVANFRVAGRGINAASATFESGVAAELRDGRRVAVDGVLAGDVLMATRVTYRADDAAPPTQSSLEGTITEFVSVARFKVAGQAVDASQSAFEDGVAAELVNGREVTVKGTMNAGVLLAAKVTFKADRPTTTLEVEGAITDFASVASFKVGGQQVDASGASIESGTNADLANGRRIGAVGPLIGGVLRATRVEIKDAPEQVEASVKGAITDFVSIANFKVATRRIDATNAKFENGNAANLANGRKVEIEGGLNGEVLVAKKVSFQ